MHFTHKKLRREVVSATNNVGSNPLYVIEYRGLKAGSLLVDRIAADVRYQNQPGMNVLTVRIWRRRGDVYRAAAEKYTAVIFRSDPVFFSCITLSCPEREEAP